MSERVLLVEDDASLKEGLFMALTDAGYTVTATGDGTKAIELFPTGNFDLVLLDIMLPGADGLSVCRKIRSESRVPIVMLTARSDTSDVVLGLESGADDYITKPFEVPELLARAKAAIRRADSAWADEVLRAGPIEVNPAAFKAYRNGEELDLTVTEMKLLLELMRRVGKAVSRKELLDRVWNYSYMGDSRLVDMAIKRLRNKVEESPAEPELIVTVRGIGYRLEG